MHLNLHPDGGEDTAEVLTGDQILGLAAAVNPEGAGTSPAWLSGPGPLNYFRTMLSRTVVNSATQDKKLHIMVVNNVNAYSLTETFTGEHWFVVAWWLNGAPSGA